MNVVSYFLLWSEFVNAGHLVKLWHHHPQLHPQPHSHLQHQRQELQLVYLHQDLAWKSRQKVAALSAETVLVLLCQMLSLRPHFNQGFPVACYKVRVSLERFRSMNVPPFVSHLRSEFVNAGHLNLVQLWHHHPHRPVLQGLRVIQVFQLLQVLQLIQLVYLLHHYAQLQELQDQRQ